MPMNLSMPVGHMSALNLQEERNMSYTRLICCLLSLVYNNNAMYDKAISLADSMRQLVPNDIELLGRAYSQIGLAKIGKRDYRGAVDAYLEKMNLNPGTMTVDDMNRLGLSYSHLGKLDSAEIFYKITLSSVDSSSVSMSYFYERKQDYENAYKSIKRMSKKMDAILRGRIRESVSGLTMAYMEEREAMLKARMERERMMNWLISAACVAVVAGVGAGWVAYRRRKVRQQQQLMADGERLALLLEKERDATNEAQKFAMELFRDNLRMLDSIFSTYAGQGAGDEADKTASAHVAALVKAFSEDSDKLRLLEDKVNKCEDGLMQDFRRDFPGKKGWVYQVELFHATGLSGRVIALLLGISPSAYYTRKSRMIKMIKEAGPKRCADYLRVLG